MPTEQQPHDVFISYAREDGDWVRRHLYEPLAACRTLDGRPARVFFDVGEHGILIGQDFQTAIENALEHALKFVPVYSRHYFHKEMCMLELRMARQRDVSFSNRFLLPVLKDVDAVHEVPFAYKTLNWQSVSDSSWFSVICQGVGLTYSPDRLSLSFLDQPGDVFASLTLPRIRVQLRSAGDHIPFQDQITIRAAHGGLLGTTTVETVNGIATFDDLSISEPAEENRLIVRCSSLSTAVESAAFSVVPCRRVSTALGGLSPPGPATAAAEATTPRANPDAGQPRCVSIPHSGDPVFFATGTHLLLIADDRVSVFGVDGTACGTRPLAVQLPLKFVRRSDQRLLFADWTGNVQIVSADGSGFELPAPLEDNSFCVPADADFHGNDVYLAHWDGSLYHISAQGERELYLRDPVGIQVIGACDDRVFVCDFDGNLRTYRNRRLVNAVSVEPVIWSLKEMPDCLVAVGNQQFYHIRRDGSKVLGFDMPISDIESVYELSALPVVMDAGGRGIRFNSDLVITASVMTQSGARPVSADDAGAFCVFRNPDSTHTLQQHGRIVFSTQDGPLAVSPSAQHFALRQGPDIRIYPAQEFFHLVEAQSAASAGASGSSTTDRGSHT